VSSSSNKESRVNIYWQLADGSDGPERSTNRDYINTAMSWSPDGQVLAFIEINPVTVYDIGCCELVTERFRMLLRL
jgi:Tol biopolymer transport system component